VIPLRWEELPMAFTGWEQGGAGAVAVVAISSVTRMIIVFRALHGVAPKDRAAVLRGLAVMFRSFKIDLAPTRRPRRPAGGRSLTR
jgi:hypothetical protein